MKTKKFIYAVIYFLLIAIAIITENLIPATLLIFLAGSDYLIIKKDNTISQLTSKLTDAESDARYWKARFDLGNMWSKKDAERIQELSAELETAKANSYTEVERKRGRKKYARLYKGKKKSVSTEQKSEQPYQIKGKTIKQLVEENLGIIIKVAHEDMFLCGYDKRGLSHWRPFVVGINNGMHSAIDNANAIMIERYDTEYWIDTEKVINAIKKHRNI